MLRTFFCVALVASPLVACGGSVASSDGPDAAPFDGATSDTRPAFDATPFDATPFDSAPSSDSGSAPETTSFDAPTVLPQVRLADFLETFGGVRVCLVDGKSGTSTSLLPAGLAGVDYEQMTAPVDVPAGDSFEVRVVKGSDGCDGAELLAGTLLADALAPGGKYTLGIFLLPGEGPSLAAHLWPDAPTPTPTGMIRAFDAMYTARAIDVSIEIGTGTTLTFANLHPGELPTTSSMGTPSAEGYMPGTDVLKVDFLYEGAGPIATFPSGLFGSGHMTLFATGSPDGSPTRADAVLCYDDLADGPLVRCKSLSP